MLENDVLDMEAGKVKCKDQNTFLVASGGKGKQELNWDSGYMSDGFIHNSTGTCHIY